MKSLWLNLKKRGSRHADAQDDSGPTTSAEASESEPNSVASPPSSTVPKRSSTPSLLHPLRNHARSSSITPSRRRTASVDRRLDPQGLTTLYTPPTAPSADIVFIHGLGGSSRLTWCKNHNPDLFWPAQWLPLDEDLSSARIFSFGYATHFGPQQKRDGLSMSDFAKDLLWFLKNPLDVDGKKATPLGQCPIIIVAHSMGGLVFKKAFLLGHTSDLYKDIVASIRAVMFLATPHRGTNLADSLNRLLRASMVYSSQRFISEMVNNAQYIEDINEQFRDFALKLRIFSFYETRETELGGGKYLMILKKSSSILGYPGEMSKPLYADHHDVCKFESPQDVNYRTISGTLKNLVSAWREEASELAQRAFDEEMKCVSQYLAASHATAEHDLNFFWSRRGADTCEWILDQQEYADWVQAPSESGVLWLHAKPGRGKSVLSAYVIHQLRECNAVVQYHFFRFGDQKERTVGSLLRSLALQLANRFPAFRHALVRLKNSTSLPKNSSDWQTIWRLIFENALFPLNLATPIYWVIDGLDESGEPEAVFRMLSTITSSTSPIRVLLVSRWTASLSESFERLATEVPSTLFCADNSYADISNYITEELRFRRWPDELKRQVIHRVAAQADGSFLWVHLALQGVKNCHTMPRVEAELSKLPNGMEGMYKRILEEIELEDGDPNQELQRQLFIWAFYTSTSVSAREMALAMEPELLDVAYTVSQLCGHFLVIGTEGRISFIHKTARDYLISVPERKEVGVDGETKEGRRFSLEPYQAHLDIFEKAILAFSDPKIDSRIDNPNAFEYRAAGWAYHLNHIRTPTHAESALGLLVEFFSGKPVLHWICILASLNKISVLLETSRRLFAFTQRLRKNDGSGTPHFNMLDDIELLQLWSRDMIKLVGKFGSNLSQQPSAIYDCVPPFCPRGSAVYRAFRNWAQESVVEVQGQSEAWDDCLSRVSVGSEHQALMITCSQKYLAVLNTAGTISLWDSVTFENAHELPHGEYVHRMCFSSNGSCIASYSKGYTKVWDAITGELKCRVPSISPSRALALCFGENDATLIVALASHRVFSVSLEKEECAWKPVGDTLLDDNHNLSGVYLNSPTAMSFSPDRTKIAGIYRRFPLTVWSLKPTRVLQRVKRKTKDDGESLAFLVQMKWHPNNMEILGILADGSILRHNVKDGSQRELEASAAMPTEIQISPDGRVFATTDEAEMIRLYDYHTFSLLYQLSCQEAVEGLCFSHDNRRFYDIRGHYCNIWEPNALVRLSEIDDHLSDGQSESASIAQSNVHSESFADMAAPITALVPAGNGSTIVCTGRSNGDVEMHDYSTDAKTLLDTDCAEMGVEILTWSGDCTRFAYEDTGGELNLFSIKPVLDRKECELWKHDFWKTVDLPFEPGGVRQTLLSADGSLLLVAFKRSAQLWSTESSAKLVSVGTTDGRWILDPVREDQVLFVSIDSITAYRWEDLAEICRWTVTSPQTPLDLTSPFARTIVAPADETDERMEKSISHAALTHSKTHLLLTISKQASTGYTRRRRPDFVLLDLAPLSSERSDMNDIPREVSRIPLPGFITEEMERPLEVFGADTFVFVDRAYWIRSVGFHELAEYQEKRRQEKQKEGTKEEKDEVERKRMEDERRWEKEEEALVKRHFFIPRDWVTTDTLNLMYLAPDGTIVLPKHGELIVIKSSLGTLC